MRVASVAVRAALVAVVLGALALPAAADLTDAQKRVFFSDDADLAAENVSGDVTDPTTYANISDVTYRTTRPTYAVGGTSVTEFRQDQARSGDFNTGGDRSYVLPGAGGSTESGPYVGGVYVEFLGVHGGAKLDLDDAPLVIDDEGTVFSNFDYLKWSAEVVVPNSTRTNKTYETETIEKTVQKTENKTVERKVPIPLPGGGVKYKTVNKTVTETVNKTKEYTVYVDGNYTSRNFSRQVNTSYNVSVGDQTYAGGRAVDYSGVDEGETEIVVNATVNTTIWVNETEHDWDPDVPKEEARSKSDGEWHGDGYNVSVHDTEEVNVTETVDAVVTDGSPEVEQTVVEMPDGTRHVILTFEGGSGGGSISPGGLGERTPWSYLALGSDHYVDGGWATYTVRDYTGNASIYYSDETSSESPDPPQVLRQHLVGTDRRPTVHSTLDDPTDTTVDRFTGTNVSGDLTTGGNIDVSAKQPLVYDRLVITDAPANATGLVTIHNETVPLDVDKSLEYRRPNVTITDAGSGAVEIEVTDPETGAAIGGKTVSVFGAESDRVQTGPDGTVTVQREGALVKATVQREDWRSASGDVVYARASASATFTPQSALAERAYDLVQTAVLISPLVLLYFYVRHFGFFE